MTDGDGKIWRVITGPGNVGDVIVGRDMVKQIPKKWKPRYLIADTAYDDRKLREALTSRGIEPVIRNHPRRKKPYPFDHATYRKRNVVERAICLIKDYQRVATRYDKLAQCYRATVIIAILFAQWIM